MFGVSLRDLAIILGMGVVGFLVTTWLVGRFGSGGNRA